MKKFKQFFLGSNDDILLGLKNQLSRIDPAISTMRFETLPFRKVEDFDYVGIAKMINEDAPDIIWVSLGAPKQEQFMNLIQPYLNRGVMFGFGAIFGFFSGTSNGAKPAPNWMIKNKLQWIFRLIDEPKKQFSRVKMILATIPRLVILEIKDKRKQSL
jgi:N-acetylglucosaminyldiphosphoundecaprenol N-acetyl-beta-D-mannosaminyltransferase